MRARHFLWVALITIGIIALTKKRERSVAQRAEDESARADWEGEGGAPAGD